MDPQKRYDAQCRHLRYAEFLMLFDMELRILFVAAGRGVKRKKGGLEEDPADLGVPMSIEETGRGGSFRAEPSTKRHAAGRGSMSPFYGASPAAFSSTSTCA